MRNHISQMFVASLSALIGATSLPGLVAASGPPPIEIAKEINFATASATAVVASLQDKINTARLAPAEVAMPALQAAMKENFRKLAGSDFDEAPDADRRAIRDTVAKAFSSVVARFREDMLRGGQDAFVPAFFRAQLLETVNLSSQGRFQAIVTNRTKELINQDSGPAKLINDQAILAYVNELLEKGEAESNSRMFNDRLVSVWPMKITEPCVACHQRNGLEQRVGQFGGATLVIVEPHKQP